MISLTPIWEPFGQPPSGRPQVTSSSIVHCWDTPSTLGLPISPEGNSTLTLLVAA